MTDEREIRPDPQQGQDRNDALAADALLPAEAGEVLSVAIEAVETAAPLTGPGRPGPVLALAPVEDAAGGAGIDIASTPSPLPEDGSRRAAAGPADPGPAPQDESAQVRPAIGAGPIPGSLTPAGQTPLVDADGGWMPDTPIGGSLESAGADQDAGEASYVVGIGASAGGLEALERLFRAMPPDTGMAFVVIQHLSPDFKSLMHELLQRFTSMATVPVDGTVLVRPNTIYLLTPKKDMVIDGHRLISYERAAEKTLNQPINTFFRSLASAWGERGVAVVLSGTGSDGSTGIMDVRETGGLVIAQTEDSSRFDGMPRSAVETGCVDAVLAPEDIPAALLAYADDRRRNAQQAPRASQERNEGIPAIFERLRTVYDIDFNYYKPGTITRRIERRVALHPEHIEIDEYVRHVEQDDAELDLLYKDLLIGVTRFFRDPEAFEILRTRVVPGIVERAPEDEDVRVWVCGCSTGEEAYSLAILFLEAFAAAGRAPRIKILATDIHRKSLLTAGEGVYPESSLTEMPEVLHRAARPHLARDREPAQGADLLRTQPAEGPAVHAHRPGQLPQPADLPGTAGAAARDRGLPLRAARRGLPVPRGERGARRAGHRVRRRRPALEDLHEAARQPSAARPAPAARLQHQECAEVPARHRRDPARAHLRRAADAVHPDRHPRQ